MPQATPAPTDWEAVETLYRLGAMSLRAIAAEHNCTEGAIRKRAKAKDWSRDLTAKVKAKAEELVRKAEVRKEVRNTPGVQASERQQVEIAAQNQANVLLEHRTDIRRGRTLFQNLLTEIEAQVASPELMEQLGELLYAPDDSGRDKLNEIYRKIISTPGRVDSAKKLTEMLEKLVKMEREAFGMNAAEPGADLPASGKPMTDVERAVRLMHFMQHGAAQ